MPYVFERLPRDWERESEQERQDELDRIRGQRDRLRDEVKYMHGFDPDDWGGVYAEAVERLEESCEHLAPGDLTSE